MPHILVFANALHVCDKCKTFLYSPSSEGKAFFASLGAFPDTKDPNSKERYRINMKAVEVLDLLEKHGYLVVSCATSEQSSSYVYSNFVWTLRKQAN